jgi:hypothetical protein
MDFGQVEDYCVQVGAINTATDAQAKQETTALHVWPVPSGGDRVWLRVPVTSKGCSRFELCVRDVYGRVVLQRTVHSDEHSLGVVGLDLTGWLPGWYSVSLFDDHQWFSGEVIRQ